MFSFISPTNTKIFIYQLTIKFRQKLMEKNEHKKLIDTGAGFYLDEDDLEEEIRKETQIVIEPCNLLCV